MIDDSTPKKCLLLDVTAYYIANHWRDNTHYNTQRQELVYNTFKKILIFFLICEMSEMSVDKEAVKIEVFNHQFMIKM